MLEIKTIKNRLDNAESFDKEINAALADGWELVRRDLFISQSESHYSMLYAELERVVEPEEEEEEPEDDMTAEWKLSRDPAYPFKCSACGCKNPEPAKRCLNCKRTMVNAE